MFDFLRYKGTSYTLFIITKAARDLYHYIKEKPKKDYTKQIQSPMPGLIKSVKCTVGDFVVIGQELCVIGMLATIFSYTMQNYRRTNTYKS